MMVGPMSPRPREFAIGGASTRAISSQKIDCCIRLALRPPYSFGHETAAHPPSYSFRCQAFRYVKDSSMGFSRHSLQSFGTFASSQMRSSSRNCFSSRVRFRSIQKTPSKPRIGLQTLPRSRSDSPADDRLPRAKPRAIQRSLSLYPLENPAESIPGLASIFCANPFLGFFRSRSLASSQKIRRNGDICSAPNAYGRIRSTRSHLPEPLFLGLRAPSALHPTFRPVRESRRPPIPQDEH